jgi:2,4'-dihydroxyacetophenone dioxygenase
MLWRNDETGASIALIKFDKGAGAAAFPFIEPVHVLSERQIRITSTGVTLTAGCFYCNPKGNVHGSAIAHEETVMVEIYDGPHYTEKPSWYTDEQDAR